MPIKGVYTLEDVGTVYGAKKYIILNTCANNDLLQKILEQIEGYYTPFNSGIDSLKKRMRSHADSLQSTKTYFTVALVGLSVVTLTGCAFAYGLYRASKTNTVLNDITSQQKKSNQQTTSFYDSICLDSLTDANITHPQQKETAFYDTSLNLLTDTNIAYPKIASNSSNSSNSSNFSSKVSEKSCNNLNPDNVDTWIQQNGKNLLKHFRNTLSVEIALCTIPVDRTVKPFRGMFSCYPKECKDAIFEYDWKDTKASTMVRVVNYLIQKNDRVQ